MSEIYITGHRNPDLDSVCSAFAYAALKNKTDGNNTYKGIRCGHLSENVQNQLASVGIEAVPYVSNVYPKVGDVMKTETHTLKKSEPVYNLIKAYGEDLPSAVPVFDGDEFFGLLTINDVTRWFLKESFNDRPVYHFETENIASVLPGKLVKCGIKEFSASIIAGAAALEEFRNFVDSDPNCVVVLGYRKEIIEYAISRQVPAIIVTTTEKLEGIDLTGYEGTVLVTPLGTAETIRRLRMTVSVGELIGESGPKLSVDTLFDEGREILSLSRLRGLSVYDGDKWVGYVTRRCFLTKPSYNVILVDHNEVGQSIRGIETANVMEIIDHHRLDALKTDTPIYIDAEPVGSTCTIVYQQYLRKNVVPDENIAKVLLVGILSDTLILKSPTTTYMDKSSAGSLAALCGIFDIQSFGEKLFSCSKSLSNSDPEKAIKSDFKTYREKGMRIGIGQYEVTALTDLDTYSEKYAAALEQIRVSSGLDWAMLMITDVLRERSVLIATDSRYNGKLTYNIISPGIYDMPGVMSRKKQLLPEVLHSIE